MLFFPYSAFKSFAYVFSKAVHSVAHSKTVPEVLGIEMVWAKASVISLAMRNYDVLSERVKRIFIRKIREKLDRRVINTADLLSRALKIVALKREIGDIFKALFTYSNDSLILPW